MDSADSHDVHSGDGPFDPVDGAIATIERLPLPPTPPPIRAHRRLSDGPPPPPRRGVAPTTTVRSPLASANAVGELGPAAVVRNTSRSMLYVMIGIAIVILTGLVVTGVMFAKAFENTTMVSNLESGDCIKDFFDQGSEGEFIDVFLVTTTDCDQPHAMEVFATTELLWSSDSYLGLDESFVVGEEWCFDQYDTFIGGDYNFSPYEVWTFVPAEQGWASGDRTVQCLVGQFDEVTLTTGTLEGIDR